MPIRKAAVIGAGVMGAAIAAQFANAGIPVLLLDIVPPGNTNRNALAEGAVAKMLAAEPAPFMSPRARLVSVGNIEDHLEQLADCDWIIEAILERLEAKQALYRQIDAVRRPGTVVSSNTSTLPLRLLIQGLSEAFARDFLITHFFNPPRYMRLLEVVTGPNTDPQLARGVSEFADVRLGKTVVFCHDSPGFIANRLGVYWLQVGVNEAIEAGLTVEEADAVVGKPMGFPNTGVFGLIDLVGLDLMPHINASLSAALAPGDPFHAANRDLPLVKEMIASGHTGRKGKGGFYRLTRSGNDKIKEVIDLRTGRYRPEEKRELGELSASKDLRALLSSDTRLGRYGWRVLGQTLAYAARLVPEAADDIHSIDAAMRLGYNWKWGPFELIDRLGTRWFAERLGAQDLPVPDLLHAALDKTFYRVEDGRRQYLGRDGHYHDVPRPTGVLLLEDIKLRSQPVLQNSSASVWDIGDGVLCFEFTSKSNSLDEQIIGLLDKTLAWVQEKNYRALVIYNEGSHFSVGANLGTALFAANMAAWSEIEKALIAGQRTYNALKYAPFPVVSAPAGMALGGGCEIALHSDAIQAHAETYMGLVECGAGLIPAWGGCKEMLARWSDNGALPKGPMPAPMKVFETVSVATVSKSAAQAKELSFLRPQDGITMNRDRLLADAKARALQLAEHYTPPRPAEMKLPGPAGKLAFMMAVEGYRRRGVATEHDTVVADALAHVLSGGRTDLINTVTEDQLLALERAAFMRLIKTEPTLARIEHLLTTNKPLRN